MSSKVQIFPLGVLGWGGKRGMSGRREGLPAFIRGVERGICGKKSLGALFPHIGV
jgi:hypothetical protein